MGDPGDMAPTPIPAGKVPADLLARVLATDRPLPPDVRLGPAVGEDACAIDVDAGVLIATTDPITLTTSELGRYAVLVNANDVAVMGVRPRWFLAAILLPLGTTDDTVEQMFATLHSALDEVGAALVGGHTEVTGAVSQPVIVGQMLGLATDGRFVTTAGARPGDVLVQVGSAPIEGAAVLAVEAAHRLTTVPADVVAAAARGARDPGISVVEAALTAASLGATAMHDPTEGGVASGLHELAMAAGVAVRVDRPQLVWFEPGLEVCRALGANPWATLASGSLLAAFPPDCVDAAIQALSAPGRPAIAIGAIEAGAGVHDTDGVPIEWPDHDEVARILAT
jgi:hydrogenase expression/formation protein HypE